MTATGTEDDGDAEELRAQVFAFCLVNFLCVGLFLSVCVFAHTLVAYRFCRLSMCTIRITTVCVCVCAHARAS